jgi:hypothetical protein
MVVSPIAPMRRLDVDALFGSSVDPSSSIFVAWKRQRMDDSIIVDDANFEVCVGRRN